MKSGMRKLVGGETSRKSPGTEAARAHEVLKEFEAKTKAEDGDLEQDSSTILKAEAARRRRDLFIESSLKKPRAVDGAHVSQHILLQGSRSIVPGNVVQFVIPPSPREGAPHVLFVPAAAASGEKEPQPEGDQMLEPEEPLLDAPDDHQGRARVEEVGLSDPSEAVFLSRIQREGKVNTAASAGVRVAVQGALRGDQGVGHAGASLASIPGPRVILPPLASSVYLPVPSGMTSMGSSLPSASYPDTSPAPRFVLDPRWTDFVSACIGRSLAPHRRSVVGNPRRRVGRGDGSSSSTPLTSPQNPRESPDPDPASGPSQPPAAEVGDDSTTAAPATPVGLPGGQVALPPRAFAVGSAPSSGPDLSKRPAARRLPLDSGPGPGAADSGTILRGRSGSIKAREPVEPKETPKSELDPSREAEPGRDLYSSERSKAQRALDDE